MLRRTLLTGLAFGSSPPRAILFTARGHSGFLNPDRRLEIIQDDGRGLRVLNVPGGTDSGWGAYGFFRDGRALLQSLALPPDWKGKTFDEYYPRSRTRLWACDLRTARLEELCHKDRLSSFYSACCLLAGESRIAITAMIQGKSVLCTANLDGTETRAITQPDEFVYGVSLAPDGRRFAFHSNYRIHVCDIDGGGRIELAAGKGTLHFGTSWSPDGEWILFQSCIPKLDPGHDWSSIAVVRADGRGPARVLTPLAAAWFGASYGTKSNPGGGSNQPQWAPAGRAILYVRRIPDARTPWQFQAGRKDIDHFNRDFQPGQARGGTHLALLDPDSGKERFLTMPREGIWDFRPSWSRDGRRICFLRAKTGGAPELWAMDSSGDLQRRLTTGVRRAGAEHPVWVW